MKRLCLLLAVVYGCQNTPPEAKRTKPKAVSAPKKPATKTVVDTLTIPGLPEWTDRYADGKKGDVRFFNLTDVMSRFQISRLEAVEVQNHYRDITRTEIGISGVDALQSAIDRVKKGQLESGIDAQALAKAKFTVVFDLDETLYDQYYKVGKSCHGFAFKRKNGKMKYIQPVPGWDDAIRKIVALGGKVVLFSANLDDTTLTNLAHMTIDGKPLTKSPLISGIMTNSHLIQQEKSEPPGSDLTPRKGRPVIEPSKDLRHFDPSLERVIIVDDNPLRLFQFRNVRVFKKFHADEWCTTKDPVIKTAYAQAMGAVVREIEDAVNYMSGHSGVSFAQAYLPYSHLGRITVDFLMDGHGWTREKAVEYIRTNPKAVDNRF